MKRGAFVLTTGLKMKDIDMWIQMCHWTKPQSAIAQGKSVLQDRVAEGSSWAIDSKEKRRTWEDICLTGLKVIEEPPIYCRTQGNFDCRGQKEGCLSWEESIVEITVSWMLLQSSKECSWKGRKIRQSLCSFVYVCVFILLTKVMIFKP